MSFSDPYPTRTSAAMEMIERREPVIYTRADSPTGPLSKQQLTDYERNGFLVLESFFPQNQLQKFFDDLEGYEDDAYLKSLDQVVLEPGSQKIRSIFGIHELSKRFNALTRDARLIDIAHQLLDSDAYIHQSRINDKSGFSGTGFNWHSDFETWHSEDGMPRMRCFSLSILLSENNELNGPLMLIPGSHKWFIPTVGATPSHNWDESLKAQTIGIPSSEHLRQLTRRGGLAAPKGPAGSVILFECNTLHASANNLSPWRRSNLFFVYNSIENKLARPFAGTEPRPEYIAARAKTPVLIPIADAVQAEHRTAAGFLL